MPPIIVREPFCVETSGVAPWIVEMTAPSKANGKVPATEPSIISNEAIGPSLPMRFAPGIA